MAGVTYVGGSETGYPMVYGVSVYVCPRRLVEAIEAAAIDVDGKHWCPFDLKRLEYAVDVIRRKIAEQKAPVPPGQPPAGH